MRNQMTVLKSVKSVENCRQPPLCAQVKLLHKQKRHFRRENGFWNCKSWQIPLEQDIWESWNCTRMKLFIKVLSQTFMVQRILEVATFCSCFSLSFLPSEFKRKHDWIFGKEFYFNNTLKLHFLHTLQMLCTFTIAKPSGHIKIGHHQEYKI